MKPSERTRARRIDLGKASVETKGVARFDIDPGAGKLNSMLGIVSD